MVDCDRWADCGPRIPRATVTSTRYGFGLEARRAALLVTPLVALCIVVVATRQGWLPEVMAISFVACLLLVGLREPLAMLILFAALVPIDGALGVSGVATASRVVGVVFAVTFVMSRRRLPRWNAIPLSGWFLVGWATASGIWAVNLADWTSVVTLVQMFVLALFVADLIWTEPNAVRPVMMAYSLSAAATVAVAVFASGTASGLSSGGRATAFGGQDTAQFSAILLPAVVFLLDEGIRGLASSRVTTLRGPVSLALAGFVAWGAVVSGTRSAVIGIAVGVAGLAAAGGRGSRGRVIVAVVAVAILGIAILRPSSVDYLVGRFVDAVPSGGSGRENIWAVGSTMFIQHPLIGVGYADFPAAFTRDLIRMTELPLPLSASLLYGRGPHSLLVGTAAELGLIGIGALVIFLLRLLFFRSSEVYATFARAAIAAMVAQALFLDILERKQLWLVIGIGAGLAAAARSARSAPSPAGESSFQVASQPLLEGAPRPHHD